MLGTVSVATPVDDISFSAQAEVLLIGYPTPQTPPPKLLYDAWQALEDAMAITFHASIDMLSTSPLMKHFLPDDPAVLFSRSPQKLKRTTKTDPLYVEKEYLYLRFPSFFLVQNLQTNRKARSPVCGLSSTQCKRK
eukprot:TRINITY_DN7390_c0_g2_i1.p2 TRINITY_DN7390_c0_g2~~TRINITY_DN7390_c0_g2_i1.p2  ORF type:complete len:136 (+),score=31.32 TRINITY_DN7390_c0_g2_i1:393-800(+)